MCVCVRLLSCPSSLFAPLSLLLWGSVTVLVWGWGPGSQAVLVTYMRDELGSCAPGSLTAVALFYIYGAAAGPAVARCESHGSSAGNRDGPVILALRWLHVTPPCPPSPPPRCSALTAAADRVPTDACTLHACTHTHPFYSFYRHLCPSVFQDPVSQPVHFCVHI